MGMPLAHRRFTVDEYHRMGEAGVLREDDHVELIDGQIVEMTPIGPAHAGCVKDLVRLLHRSAGDAVLLGVQDPVVLGTYVAPEPDVAVLRPRPGGYRDRHPEPADILLIIEVADTSLEYDRSVKIPRYASAGIPEVWLVNLPDRHVAVYRHPKPDGYTQVTIVTRGATLTPLALPNARLSVDEILDG